VLWPRGGQKRERSRTGAQTGQLAAASPGISWHVVMHCNEMKGAAELLACSH